jgi:signal peptidase
MTRAKLAQLLVAGAAVVALLGAMTVLLAPRLMHWETVVILTGSMEPVLDAGGIAYVDTTVDTAMLGEGDIVTFRRFDRAVVTHRIIGRVQDSSGLAYQTKGDANGAPDQQLVRPADVMGRVVVYVPKVGAWSQWLQEGANFQLLLGPVAAAVVLNELWSIATRLRRSREAEAEPDAHSDGWRPIALVVDGLPRAGSTAESEHVRP